MTDCVKYTDAMYGGMWRCMIRHEGKTVMPVCFENNIAKHRNGSGQTHAPTHGAFHARLDWIDRNLSLNAQERYTHLIETATTREDYEAAHAAYPVMEKEDKKNAKLFKQQFPEVKQYNYAYSSLSRNVSTWRNHQSQGIIYDYRTVFHKALLVEDNS